MEHTFTARVLFALVRSHRREHQHVPDLSVGATVASQQGGKQSRFSRDGARAELRAPVDNALHILDGP
jgi:hypothetical protein